MSHAEDAEEVDRMVDCSYASYFQSEGTFRSVDEPATSGQVVAVGVGAIAFLQDFSEPLKKLVDRNFR